jgi:hypothetical protein
MGAKYGTTESGRTQSCTGFYCLLECVSGSRGMRFGVGEVWNHGACEDTKLHSVLLFVRMHARHTGMRSALAHGYRTVVHSSTSLHR